MDTSVNCLSISLLILNARFQVIDCHLFVLFHFSRPEGPFWGELSFRDFMEPHPPLGFQENACTKFWFISPRYSEVFGFLPAW